MRQVRKIKKLGTLDFNQLNHEQQVYQFIAEKSGYWKEKIVSKSNVQRIKFERFYRKN